MDIKFTGKYKSITAFEWLDIPRFAVITGANGTGKSQLLKLIYNTIIDSRREQERVTIENEDIQRHEVTFIQGEWQLSNTSGIDIFRDKKQYFDLFKSYRNYYGEFYELNEIAEIAQIRLTKIFLDIANKIGKPVDEISEVEFYQELPEIIIEDDVLLGQKIQQIFHNYRLSEIDLIVGGKTEIEIINEIGQKPWIVLEDILKESKLPFSFNDPSENKIRDIFQLKVNNKITGDPINFNDLSSGEKVLISLVFYLYNSQEKNIFPKLLLLDEPDAHLHPTMSHQFLNTIKNVLVDKYNLRVIMTTHSPSTVALTDDESLFEMSRIDPRIKKSSSKNRTISLLTSGLVYVGKGTHYFLVEDEDDSKFYSHIYDHLTSESIIDGDIPCVFIKASTQNNSGGKSVVSAWVEKLQKSGLEEIIQGIIDNDLGNKTSQGVYKIKRYSIENYLIDPIITYAALMENENHTEYFDCGLKLGEEYRLKYLKIDHLQEIADTILGKIELILPDYFDDYNSAKETIRETIKFTNGLSLEYPQWLLNRQGKKLLNQAYNKIFTGKVINCKSLFKAFRKVNFIPTEIVDLFNEIRKVN